MWSLDPSDYADADNEWVRVAGSYQVLGSSRGPFEAASFVPGFDGVHIVDQPLDHAERGLFFFIRHDSSEVHLADPAGVLVDDVRSTLRRYADRLHVD